MIAGCLYGNIGNYVIDFLDLVVQVANLGAEGYATDNFNQYRI